MVGCRDEDLQNSHRRLLGACAEAVNSTKRGARTGDGVTMDNLKKTFLKK